MHKILDKVERLLQEYEGREMSSSALDVVHKLTDIKKNILKIEMLEGGGYSEEGESYGEMSRRGYSRNSYEGGSYRGSYEGGSSARRRRDSMGRFSRSDGKVQFVEMLEEAMENAPDERSRKMLHECLEELR